MSFTPGTCAQNAAVSGATNKSVSCRTPAVSSPSGTCLTLADRIDVRDTPSAGHPESRLVGYVAACGSIRVTQRVLKPDGDVRQDIGLLIAPDTEARSAKVSGVKNFSKNGVRQRTPIYQPARPLYHPRPLSAKNLQSGAAISACLRSSFTSISHTCSSSRISTLTSSVSSRCCSATRTTPRATKL